jgi:eukaryotic-like serine/threonine-protein kinase
MDLPARPPSVLQFGPFELNPITGELRESGTPRALPAQPFRVLTLLTARAGELVTREEIQRTLWGPRDYLEVDRRINFCVNQIRNALRDPAETSQYIKTVPRRGYRFVAPITRIAVPSPAPEVLATLSGAEGSSQAARPAAASDATRSVDANVSRTAPPRMQFRFAALLVFALLVLPVTIDSSRIALEPSDSIVVAEFMNTTGDAVFDDTLTQELVGELRQSPFLNVLPDARVHETLRMMSLPETLPVTHDIARELCLRSGSKAVLNGTVAPIGVHYYLTIEAIACGTGEVLASEHGEATRKEEVLTALTQATSRLRISLGESLPSVEKFEAPAPVTTRSLEALKSYSLGLRVSHAKGDVFSIPFLKRALELDPDFALAYARLAGIYSNLDQPTAALAYEAKAYALRDSVTEPERLQIAVIYFRLTGEVEKCTQTLEMWASEYPGAAFPHGSLGVNYVYMGQYQKAAAEWEEALRLGPNAVSMYENLAAVYLALNEASKARSVVDAAQARHLDSAHLRRAMYGLAFLRRDSAEMNRQVEWSLGKPGVEDLLLAMQSDTEAYFGRLREAQRLSHRAIDSAIHADLRETAALWQVTLALTEAEFGDRRAAIHEVVNALALSSGRNVRVVAALTFARAGLSTRADELVHQLEDNDARNTVLMLYRLPSIQAAIALARNDPTSALELLEPSRSSELGQPTPSGLASLYPVYLRGEAYLLLRNGPAAMREFQKILDNPGIALNSPLGSLAQLQWARAAVLTKDVEGARRALRSFFELWKDADTNIPILSVARSELARLQSGKSNGLT